MSHTSSSRGFTLLELSIVMVIIGLIVGGIFFGQDLIVAAAVRSDVAALQQFDAAAAEFDNKYKCMPGDCANASTFFSMGGIGDGTNNGDGNGMIDAPSQYWYINNPEPEYFFVHLYLAGLSAFRPTGVSFPDGVPGGAYPAARTQGGYLPYTAYLSQASIDGAGTSLPAWIDGKNYWRMGMGKVSLVSQKYPQFTDDGGGFYPSQAYAFDSKIDDGFPLKGAVRAMCESEYNGGHYGGIQFGALAGTQCEAIGKVCVSATGENSYNFSEKDRACGLRIQAGF